MSCKFPKTSRSYMFCAGCSSSYTCDESTITIPQMPEVHPPKNYYESEIEKAIKLLIDNGYSVTKINKASERTI